MSQRHVIGLALLLVVLVVLSPTLAAANADGTDGHDAAQGGSFQTMRRNHNYSNVKEDLMCRACVALAGEYFTAVLPAMRDRYGGYVMDGTPTRPYRERMIAELHESVDGLCVALKARHAEARAAESDGTAHTPLSGSTADLNEAIDIACPSTLENIEEAFTTIAFAYLLPDKFPSEKADATTGTAPLPEASAPPSYMLPKAGAFCETHKQCLPYVHYHITSVAGGPGQNKASLTKGEHDAMERGLAEQQEKHRQPGRAEEVPGAAADDDEPSLLEALADPATYQKLPERVPWEAVSSPTFWKWVVHYMFRDHAVQFHVRDRLVFVVTVVVSLFAGFCAVVCFCTRGSCPSSPSAAANAAGAEVCASPSSTSQARKTSVSGTRRRAPARKEG